MSTETDTRPFGEQLFEEFGLIPDSSEIFAKYNVFEIRKIKRSNREGEIKFFGVRDGEARRAISTESPRVAALALVKVLRPRISKPWWNLLEILHLFSLWG